MSADQLGLARQRDDLFAEVKRGQRIIDELVMFRERILTSRTGISAERVELILAEDARYDDGLIANAGFLAVKIAESVEADWQAAVAFADAALAKARGDDWYPKHCFACNGAGYVDRAPLYEDAEPAGTGFEEQW